MQECSIELYYIIIMNADKLAFEIFVHSMYLFIIYLLCIYETIAIYNNGGHMSSRH